ncbi:hypothetical protein GCM10023195_83350 [Actinoallomurus liliacearum]|uniref:Uncharacterized protein n=1 Tax=Actinoallomurus liliacearum TaxID=1080073 RepID=A0ABP8TX53_9ACTN
MMHFLEAMGWLALFVVGLPALGYLLVMLLARPRPPATFAAGYWYTVPADPEYMVTPFHDHFFCSPEEASAAGFHGP